MNVNWYGNFDLKYAGASINCNTDYKFRALEKFITRRRSHYYVNPDDVEPDKINDVYLYNTAYFHEARHVHEHLQCPVLSYMYKERLMALFHSLQFVFNWDDFNTFNYNTLPIPLNKWFRLTKKEKEEYIHIWTKEWHTTNLQVPDADVPPNKPLRDSSYIQTLLNTDAKERDNKLLDLMLLSSAYYDEYERIRAPKYDQGNCEYSIKTLIEASAFAHQATAIALLFGAEGESYIHDIFSKAFENKRFTNYTTIITFIFRYLNYAGFDLQDLYPFVSYLINWCLSGNVLSKNSIANPIERLKNFTENNLAAKITMQDIYHDPIGVFAYWDKQLGSDGLNYDEYCKYNFNEFEKLKHAMSSIGYDHISQLYDHVVMIEQASDIMLHKFIEAPNKFMFPELYLKNLYDYINIPVRFVINAPLKISKKELESPFFDWSLCEENRNKEESNTIIHYISSDQPRFPLSPNHAYLIPTTKAILSHKKSVNATPFFLLTDALFDTDYANSPGRIIKEFINSNLHVGMVWG